MSHQDVGHLSWVSKFRHLKFLLMNFGNRKFKFQGEFQDPWSLGSTKLVDVIVLSLIKLAKIILSGRLQVAILTFLS